MTPGRPRKPQVLHSGRLGTFRFISLGHHQASAVITNSTFTKAAEQATAKTRCLLIDKSQIPDLIAGKIRLSTYFYCHS
ncbi:hypothetical protein BH23PLA1_BH23PLA1_19320 [soil metagenome]